MTKLNFNNGIDRSLVPENNIMPKLKLKNDDFFKLNNGLTISVIENNKLPIVKIKLKFDIEPILLNNKVGIRELFSGMIRSGTKNYKKEEIEDIIDQLGTSIYTSSSVFLLSSLKKNLDKSIELFSDILLNSTFNNILEFKKLKKQEITNIEISEKDINLISERIRKFLTFGKNHPYGEFLSKKSINNININDLKKFYKQYFIPKKAYMVFIGNIKKSEVLKLCNKYFLSWNNNSNDINDILIKNENFLSINYNHTINNIEIFFLDMPHVNQSNISFFKALNFKKNFSDYYSGILSNGILGGGIQSRICQNLREDKGYTYGAYSILSDDRFLGNFFISTQVRTDVTCESIEEIIKEINKILYNPVSEEELKIKKNEICGNFLLKIENYNFRASLNINTYLEKLPKNFYQNYIKNIQSTSIDDILKFFQKYIEYNKYKILVIGNADKILDKLNNLGHPINIIDKFGTYLN